MRANRTLETMKQQEARCSGSGAQPMKLDEVAVGGIPPLQHRWCGLLSAEEFSPQSLQVAAGNPPGGRVNYLAPHQSPVEGWHSLSPIISDSGRSNWKSRSLGSGKAPIRVRPSVSSPSEG